MKTAPKKSFLTLTAQLAFSVASGMFCGLVIHYLLYRFLLPVKPFVYVSF